MKHNMNFDNTFHNQNEKQYLKYAMYCKLTVNFTGKSVASEFHSYTMVKITVKFRINTYFKGTFHRNLGVKSPGNLFASEINN